MRKSSKLKKALGMEFISTKEHLPPLFLENLLIYLTNAGGKTVVGDEYHDPREDDVITFGGDEHYHYTPEKERRIVIVATFI